MPDQENHYYSREVAQKLGIPETEMWRMKSLQKHFHGKQGFPRQIIDSIAESWASVLCKKCQTNYYQSIERDLIAAKRRMIELEMQNKNSRSREAKLKQQLQSIKNNQENSKHRVRELEKQVKKLESHLAPFEELKAKFESPSELRDKLDQEKSKNLYLRRELKKCQENSTNADATIVGSISSKFEQSQRSIDVLHEQLQVATERNKELEVNEKHANKKLQVQEQEIVRLTTEIEQMKPDANLLHKIRRLIDNR